MPKAHSTDLFYRAIDGGGNGWRYKDFRINTKGNFIPVIDSTHGPDKSCGPLDSLNELWEFIGQDSLRVGAILYAIAGVIENHDLMVSSPNIHLLDGIELATETQNRFHVDSAVFNDMEAAVAGMYALLPKPKPTCFLGITWSSGIGVRVCKDGKILGGSEAGHMTLDFSASAPFCGCGKRGCAEAIIGGEAIKYQVLRLANAYHSIIPASQHPLAFADEYYSAGGSLWTPEHSWTQNLYQQIAHTMGLFLANILQFAPDPIFKIIEL